MVWAATAGLLLSNLSLLRNDRTPLISDGNLTRGHRGLAGEIAHLITTGPRGQAMRLIDVFGALELRQAGSTAVDVGRLLAEPTPSAACARASSPPQVMVIASPVSKRQIGRRASGLR